MSDWAWITFGYAVVYGGMISYAAFLARRFKKARSHLEQPD